jgi:hypothetical protein
MKRILAVAALLLMAACAPTGPGTTPTTLPSPPLTLSQADSLAIENYVDQLLNTGVQQLTLTQNVALSFTPPDTGGAQCAGGGITVVQELQKTQAVLQGQQLGGIPAAEVMSVMIPDSDQFNNVVDVLGSQCFIKARTVNSSITAASNPALIIGTALGGLQGIAPAVAPLALVGAENTHSSPSARADRG